RPTRRSTRPSGPERAGSRCTRTPPPSPSSSGRSLLRSPFRRSITSFLDRTENSMKQTALVVFLSLMGAGLPAQDAPPTPKPQKEHEWLQQLVGEWETEGEAVAEPDKPPVKTKG